MMDDKQDKNRNDIASTLTKQQMDALANPPVNYNLPPGTPGVNGVLRPIAQPVPAMPQPTSSLSLDAYGEGGSIDPMRRLQQPYAGVRARYGVQF